ncbi:hypothetical protein GCM10022393_40670 [Aquimarina addita]|uniref:Uncharacterized protein n=1 Tax=Aquimarina addita TaxID=870485 RepID=A0ABP6UXJ4_9FLAO
MNNGLFYLIFDLAKIAGGLLLAQSVFTKYDSVGKLTNFLSGFQAIIGSILSIMGALYVLIPGCFLMDLAAILAGLVLLGVALKSVPGIGDILVRVSNILKAFAIPIGIGALVSGILGILNFCL